MHDEIQTGIKVALTANTALTTALGNATQIVYGWPSVREATTDTLKVLLAWGADLIGGGQGETGNAASVTQPSFDVPFHLFSQDPNYLNAAADALYDLWNEATMSTTHYEVLRVYCTSDISMFESDRGWHHRVVTFRFDYIFEN